VKTTVKRTRTRAAARVDPAACFPFPLDPFQQQAIAALDAGRSVVVCAPTGAGKTVVGEYAIHAALAEGARVFYTTPLKALSNQKFRDFGAQFGAEKIGLLTGDVTIHRDAPVVVMTTEVFRNMLYGAGEPVDLGRVRFVVLDECHYINDAGRGTVWEEAIICCPREIQLIALSATIANADQLADWIDRAHGETELVYSDVRPVPLRHHYFQYGELRPLFKQRGRQPSIAPAWRRHVRPWDATPDPDEVVAVLAEREMLPAIYFVFSRRGCEHALMRCAGRSLLTPEEAEQLETRLAEELERVPSLREYPFLRHLREGLAVHHAGLLPSWKPPIERLFQAGLVKVVFATETLAAGINMPARTTIISSLGKRGDHGYRTLTASEFLQMSGRAGRRGIDRLGHVVVLAEPFRPAAEAVELAASPPDPLLSRFTPTYGLVLNLLRRHTPAQAERLLRRSFGQYLADGHRRRRRVREHRAGRDAALPTRCRYWERFCALQSVLEAYGYVWNDRPTAEGLLAAALRTENELFVAEVLRSDLWQELSPAGLAAVLVTIITEELRPEVRIDVRPGRAVARALEQVRAIARDLRAAQRRRRVDVPVRLVERTAGLVEYWAEGASWPAVCVAAEMDEGDIVHLFRRLLDLLQQIPQVPGVDPRLAEMARAASAAIDREPVNEVL